MRRLLAIMLALVMTSIALPLIAQESDEAQKSGFLRFVEDQISTPERAIAFNGLEGALSSNVSVAEITISDTDGVWMRIQNAVLNWDQGALLTGRLQINTLTADSIEYIRQSIPAEGMALPSPEAPSLEIPELPVAVFLEKLSVPKVIFSEQLFGLGSEISVDGRLILEGGSLDTNLAIERKDGPGGALTVALKYDRESTNTDIDLALTEPSGGVIVNLLDMDEKPELSLRINGSGPLAALNTDLTLDAGGTRALTGKAALNRTADGLSIDANLFGPIGDLAPVAYKSFFGPETRLTANALISGSGGVTLNNLTLGGGELTLQASARTAADGFLSALNLEAQIAGRDGRKARLPGGGGAGVDTAKLQIDYGNNDSWSGQLSISGLETSDLAAQTIALNLSGAALNLSTPTTRRVTFNADGAISGITSNDPQVADALGNTMGLGIAGLWNAGTPLKIAEARLTGKAFDLALDGNLDGAKFDGNLSITTPSIAPFSGVANRQLSGGLQLATTGTIQLLNGGFDLSLDGTADNLSIGADIADAILAGQTRLSGRIARTETGVIADQFKIGNAQSEITADGTFASDAANFQFQVALQDLGLLSKDASGALVATGTAKGAGGEIALAFDARVPTGSLSGHRLTDASLGFDGMLTETDISGDINGNAMLDGHLVDLTASVANADGASRMTNLKFNTAGTTFTGDLHQNADKLLTGQLNLQSSNISVAAALLLADAEGAADAAIELAPLNGQQSAKITANVSALHFNDVRVGSAAIDAEVADLFGVPAVNGSINSSEIFANGFDLDMLGITANHQGDATSFAAAAKMANGAILDSAGRLSPIGDGYRITLDQARLEQGDLSARLADSTTLTVANNTISLQDLIVDIGNGRITSSGTAGEKLDLALEITDVPLGIANAIMPDLRLAGALNGKLRISGKAAAPSINFDMSGDGINAAMIAPYGITPLQIDASGTFADNTLKLVALRANGPENLILNASGTMPLVGSNGTLKVTGNIPLTLANKTVGNRGTQLSGTIAIDANVSGSLAKPSFGGAISTENAEIVDPLSNLRLQSISANARLAGEQVIIESFNGNLATGGAVNASGSVSLNAGAGFPADIQIGLNSARYADGNLFVATASGQLTVTGSLLGNPLLAGDVQVENAEISIPDSFDTSAVLLDVDHKALPADVARTLKRVLVDSPTGNGAGQPSVVQVNVSVTAPNQIFVRGRGIDAELGGQVQLRGNINNIQPVGGFQLVRGRLDILGQRIVFTSGNVTLVGTLDPYINLTAQSATDDTTVFVAVNGPASNLDIDLSSTPELPQDEILSLLIFKRALGDLSPLQLVKLAAAAAELAGGSNNSLVSNLRSAAGLADIDVVTDDQNNTAVRVGTYIQDNVYVSVQAGAQGDSKVSIDLDLTDTLKARGSATGDGETSVGIFYEQDY